MTRDIKIQGLGIEQTNDGFYTLEMEIPMGCSWANTYWDKEDLIKMRDWINKELGSCEHKNTQSAMCEVDYCSDCDSYLDVETDN